MHAFHNVQVHEEYQEVQQEDVIVQLSKDIYRVYCYMANVTREALPFIREDRSRSARNTVVAGDHRQQPEDHQNS